jgi:hypothetical protein
MVFGSWCDVIRGDLGPREAVFFTPREVFTKLALNTKVTLRFRRLPCKPLVDDVGFGFFSN